jgi:hypothetical protein
LVRMYPQIVEIVHTGRSGPAFFRVAYGFETLVPEAGLVICMAVIVLMTDRVSAQLRSGLGVLMLCICLVLVTVRVIGIHRAQLTARQNAATHPSVPMH